MNGARGLEHAGLLNERTTLAWSRTALSVVALGALTARQSGSARFGAGLLVAVLLTAVAMSVRADRRHHRRTEQLRAGQAVGALAEVMAATATVLALAACSAFVTLT